MLLAGDELGHSQGGNNNAYAQDNETTWVNWESVDAELMAFVARLTRLRADHPVLRQRHFLHGRLRSQDHLSDVIWRRADGRSPEPGQWHDPAFRCLGLELRMSTQRQSEPDTVFAVFNMGPAQALTLPDTVAGWRMILDTTRPDAPADDVLAPVTSGLMVPANAVLVFTPVGGPK